MSQLPPCSPRRHRAHRSLATRSKVAPFSEPRMAFLGWAGWPAADTAGIGRHQFGLALVPLGQQFVRRAQPISPGCVRPANRTPGICRDVAKMPFEVQIALAASG